MTEWVDVVEKNTIEVGEVFVVELEGTDVAIFNVSGEFYAIQDICTHDGSEISTGCVFEHVIECPHHGAQFDIRTGAVLQAPAYEAIRTFPVRVEKGMIQVLNDDGSR
ncbi:MAG: ferredoxin [Acidiferrobacteraceae bacterium]|jgi:3-phenylpropionate/trans-cinnamate dioxygenase ferredoxin subunit|nr:ferredoxin [Acidiferrobacteraceae bacterium]|tara:strand:+ start:232 stop:555 length:324 start_codon:yes stop_codon:yes gene_type:complete